MSDLDQKIKEMARQKQENAGKESDFLGIFKFFFNKDGILGKTLITAKQRNMLYVYSLQHAKHPTWGLDKANETLGMLFISQDGKSREQGIELFRGLLSQIRQESVSIDATNNKNDPKP